MKLTLHVGLKKTATSTIQHALSVAKPKLAASGVLFPATSDAHHRLARSVIAAEAGDARMQQIAAETVEVLAGEARSAGLDHVVLSSEHLISATAGAVWRLRDMLDRQFPEITDFAVLCYVREPVSFATSMCQQNLKNGVVRLADFYADPWPYTVAAWLENYIDCFGRESVRVRYFHPDHLKNGDIMHDFMDAIGLPETCIPPVVRRRNQALSYEGVLVADALVSLDLDDRRVPSRRAMYRRLLKRIEGRRFVLPSEVQERVIEGCRDDLAALKAVFGLDITPERMEAPDGIIFSEATALSMAERIVEQVGG
jgi:hypothetical protein